MAKKAHINIEDLPKRETKKHIKHKDYGSGGDPYYPIKRQIEQSVGRVWDEVYAELKKKLNDHPDKAHWMGDRIKRDINLYVVDVRKIGKKKVPFNSKDEPVYDTLWKHPVTGVVMKEVKRPKSTVQKDPPKYITIDGKNYRVIKGAWFEVELVDIPMQEDWTRTETPDPSFCFPVRDVISMTNVNGAVGLRRLHDRVAYAKSKRALSGAEIKKLGLADKFAGDMLDEYEDIDDPRYIPRYDRI